MLTALSLDNLLWQMVRLHEEYTYMCFAKYDKTCKNSSVCFFSVTNVHLEHKKKINYSSSV